MCMHSQRHLRHPTLVCHPQRPAQTLCPNLGPPTHWLVQLEVCSHAHQVWVRYKTLQQHPGANSRYTNCDPQSCSSFCHWASHLLCSPQSPQQLHLTHPPVSSQWLEQRPAFIPTADTTCQRCLHPQSDSGWWPCLPWLILPVAGTPDTKSVEPIEMLPSARASDKYILNTKTPFSSLKYYSLPYTASLLLHLLCNTDISLVKCPANNVILHNLHLKK